MLKIVERRFVPAGLISLVTVASCAFGVFIAIDSVRTVARIYSPLPWFDAWAIFQLFKVWVDHAASPAAILFAQHNEHRILVPRLVFFADAFWFHGLGQIGIAAIFVVQTLHAALFVWVLGRARPVARGRWVVGGIVVALMFSLGQAENFSSAFQLTFVGVFAAATASFLLFARGAARPSGQERVLTLAGSFVAALVAAFTMANGIVAGFILVAMALLARQGWRVTLAGTAWAIAIGIVYVQGYVPVAQSSRPSEALAQPLAFLSYVAIYLGSVLGPSEAPALALGAVGIVAAIAATVRVGLARPLRPSSLMLVGVMLFAGATAAMTASGRINYTLQQALSSRYVTGSATFWCAQLCFWWTDPPAWPTIRTSRVGVRTAVGVLGVLLAIALGQVQSRAKPALWSQSFKQNDASNLLLLGLDDPAVIGLTTFNDADVQFLMPMLRERGLSIFGGPDGGTLGAPLARSGDLVPPGTCTGALTSAVADPGLGPDGARISGQAWNLAQRRQIRRILLTDDRGIVVGFASSGIPGRAPSIWRGYAVATPGTTLSAYGVLEGRRLCALGSAPLAAATSGEGKPSHAS